MTTAATTSTNGAAPITGGGPTHAEAPASATVRATHTATGYEWMLTCRADSVRDLVARVEYLTTWLADNGWTPATTRPAAPSSTTAAGDPPPVCPYHDKPMTRRSRDGRSWWSCNEKLPNGEWCQYRPKDRA